MKIDICLPIKNEETVLKDNINKLLDYLTYELNDFSWQITGVVNGSVDKSYEILKEFEKNKPSAVKALLIEEPGKGRALKKAWDNSQADILVFMDADLAVNLEATRSLIMPLVNNEADLVLGSRFLKNSVTKRSKRRGFLSLGYVTLSKLILNHGQSDIQCGFKGIKKETYDSIKNFIFDDYWFFDTELVTIAKLAGYKIKEVPVKWQENRVGTKKSNVKVFQDSLKFLKNVITFSFRLRKVKKYLNKF